MREIGNLSDNKFDKVQFASVLYNNAEKTGYGHGRCAAKVREALDKAGVSTEHHPVAAKDYGIFLKSRLFTIIFKIEYVPQLADIIVFNCPPPGHPYGHIQGFVGRNWVSDHVQTQGFFPHHDYRQPGCNYEIYRRL